MYWNKLKNLKFGRVCANICISGFPSAIGSHVVCLHHAMDITLRLIKIPSLTKTQPESSELSSLLGLNLDLQRLEQTLTFSRSSRPHCWDDPSPP